MGKALDTLLTALATTAGNTVEEKMEKLIADGAIFTPNLDSMRGIARGMDRTTLCVSSWLEMASNDIEATELSKRLHHIGVEVSKEEVRSSPAYYSPEFVKHLEENYRRLGEMRFSRARAQTHLGGRGRRRGLVSGN